MKHPSISDIGVPVFGLISGYFVLSFPHGFLPGVVIITATLFLIVITIFEFITKCNLCDIDERHSLIDCTRKRLFRHGVEQ